jgi:hypothetical protein
MAQYVGQHGTVLVIRYPVRPRTSGDGPLPPIFIGPGPQGQSASSEYIAYTVWEPYESHAMKDSLHGKQKDRNE